LSSSAALEIACLRALRKLFDLRLDDVALARLGQRAEHEVVGARVGIMDQMACGLAEPGTALFLDTRTLGWERVPIPPAVQLAVIDSGVRHAHAAGDYNLRRAECERACAALGIASLRALPEADLPRVSTLPEPLGRRAHHVVTENARVTAAVDALRAGDAPGLGALFVASHASQRDDYAVSIPEVDALVELAVADADVYGARLTGGGFGGAVVLIARPGRAGAAADRIAKTYARRSGRLGRVLVPARA
jgi:galactokinase